MTMAHIVGYAVAALAGGLAVATLAFADWDRLFAVLIPFHFWTVVSVLWLFTFVFAVGFALGRARDKEGA